MYYNVCFPFVRSSETSKASIQPKQDDQHQGIFVYQHKIIFFIRIQQEYVFTKFIRVWQLSVRPYMSCIDLKFSLFLT